MKKPNLFNVIIGLIFIVLFILTYRFLDTKSLWVQLLTIVEIFIALINFLPRKTQTAQADKSIKKFSKSSILAILFVVIAVPATILAGHFILQDKRFNLISILVILELLIPFFLSFESKKPSVRELVIISVICALAVAGRIVFTAIPQFKPIVAIIIITGICLGAEKGFLIGAISALVSNMYFGQGSWTPWQMLALGAMGLLAGIVFNKGLLNKNRLTICIFGGIATVLIYGGIANSEYLLFLPTVTFESIVTTYVMALPFDIIHSASTIFFLWFIAEPMIEKLERIKTKYNILK